ncbi:3-phenylpropionate/cinnamic acid dioxygenase ferredoxin--NAD(+) reductase subunit [Neisseriaceae bacterium CLB008]
MNMTHPIIIVGAGQAGSMVCVNLRQNGYAGPIVLIGAEGHHPYERPPLSKDALLNPEAAPTPILPPTYFAEQAIDYRSGATVVAIDRVAETVTLDTGEVLAYAQLVLCMGARIRQLPLLDALGTDRVHTLRTLEDAHKLRSVLQPNRRVALVGGGVIGLELAASAMALGCAEVTVIEQGGRVMQRIAPVAISDYLLAYHQAQGVRVHLDADIVSATKDAAGSIQLTLASGQVIKADDVIYGIGVVPNMALAEAAGLVTQQGIVIDHRQAQTNDPKIYAAGDVATCFNAAEGSYTRRETWENANLQAAKIARSILGLAPTEDQAAWFWTDQYTLNIQFVGDMAADRWVCRGEMANDQFILFGLDDAGVLVGAVAVNMGRDVRFCRQLIAAQKPLDATLLSDEAVKLKTLCI